MTDNKKQWYLLILATVWLLISFALVVVAFYNTRDLHSFALTALTAPPVVMLQQLYRYHFPPSKEDYEHKETMSRIRLEVAQEKSRRKQGLAGEL
jgi:hypothetical protein